jgi:hypothetical protein
MHNPPGNHPDPDWEGQSGNKWARLYQNCFQHISTTLNHPIGEYDQTSTAARFTKPA